MHNVKLRFTLVLGYDFRIFSTKAFLIVTIYSCIIQLQSIACRLHVS